ncbi:hypothetical protein DFP73DRAFT_544999 [Morchella snyderi]|nr:hypothetical protein DFP73DRAFT_544999 [Morchella snyderi]
MRVCVLLWIHLPKSLAMVFLIFILFLSFLLSFLFQVMLELPHCFLIHFFPSFFFLPHFFASILPA